MKLGIAAIFLVSCASQAQVLEQPKRFNVEDWAFEHRYQIAADISGRMMDAWSTHRFETNPCHCFHEVELPNFIAEHNAAMIGYSLSAVASQSLLSYELEKHHHHKLSNIPLTFDASMTIATSIHNLTMHKK